MHCTKSFLTLSFFPNFAQAEMTAEQEDYYTFYARGLYKNVIVLRVTERGIEGSHDEFYPWKNICRIRYPLTLSDAQTGALTLTLSDGVTVSIDLYNAEGSEDEYCLPKKILHCMNKHFKAFIYGVSSIEKGALVTWDGKVFHLNKYTQKVKGYTATTDEGEQCYIVQLESQVRSSGDRRYHYFDALSSAVHFDLSEESIANDISILVNRVKERIVANLEMDKLLQSN